MTPDKMYGYKAAMPAITAEELEARIIEILDYGRIVLPNHVCERMGERNYAMGDIKHILKTGKILNFKNQGKEEYHCEIHGEDLEGVKGAVIAIVVKNFRLIIVTVLGGV